ncbi:MerR family transcriptional regulator [Motilimonas cestriensis]|uniref:MerR family transcriptional regulator n=1 Tax=Motilimonas cestriensis TaxID=2742685 RepID=UPI003DA2952D
MLTNEIARAAGVTAETVRFYTRKGLLSATKDPSNGYKRYDQAALERLIFINHARNIGFSLQEIADIIEHSQREDSPCPKVRQMLSDKIADTKDKIAQLQRHLKLMETTFADWATKPDMAPNGQAICCLIANWSQQGVALDVKEQDHDK